MDGAVLYHHHSLPTAITPAMSINNSSQVIIKGKATLNNVQGNQINQTFNAEVIHMNGQNMVERTEYDEFEYIKRGHVIALKKVYSEDVVEWEWRIGGPVRRDIDARKNVYIVKLHGMEGQTFTAITFEGADACTIWRKDFAHFSLDRDPGSFQLFGINQSKMPSLIFHNELVPIAQFSGKQSLWMQVYLAHLLFNMGHVVRTIWMDARSGLLITGLDGPDAPYHAYGTPPDVSFSIPMTADMVKEGNILRFFSTHGSKHIMMDDYILKTALFAWHRAHFDDILPAQSKPACEDRNHFGWRKEGGYAYFENLWRNPPCHLPFKTIGHIRFDTVYADSLGPTAVARWPQSTAAIRLWRWTAWTGLKDKIVYKSGLTRFTFDGPKEVIVKGYFNWEMLWRVCASQFPRIGSMGSGDSDKRYFVVDPTSLTLQTVQDQDDDSNDSSQRPRPTQPVYLFIHPPPMSISDLMSWKNRETHYWSFDKTGQSRIVPDDIGVPRLVPFVDFEKYQDIEVSAWSIEICNAMRDWQVVRGFDPSTADFARSMGCQELEILERKETIKFEEAPGTIWNWKAGTFWEAIAGSNISAFGM